jgi:hypothetical protein
MCLFHLLSDITMDDIKELSLKLSLVGGSDAL